MDDSTAIDVLTRLVSIASPSGQEANASEFLATTMRRLGFSDVEVDASGSAVGVRSMSGGSSDSTTTIVLLGHIDTVPGWIEPKIEGDLLFGRGSVDAKGPLAAMVIAAARARLAPNTRVVVVGAVEEESASSKGARHAATQWHPNYCVIGEPSGWDAYTIGYKGRLLVDYSLEQHEGHWAGQRVAAGEIAIDWWNELKRFVSDLNQDRPRLFDQVLLALRGFQTHNDGMRDRADVRIGLRLPIDFDRSEFERIAKDCAGVAEVRFHAFEQAWQSPRTSPLATAFGSVIRQKGSTPRAKLKTGTSDMNVVGPIWRCPILAYGPGDSALDHTPHEHLSLGEYLKSIAVLQEVIESLPSLVRS